MCGLFKEREYKLGHCQQIRVSRVESSKVVAFGIALAEANVEGKMLRLRNESAERRR